MCLHFNLLVFAFTGWTEGDFCILSWWHPHTKRAIAWKPFWRTHSCPTAPSAMRGHKHDEDLSLMLLMDAVKTTTLTLPSHWTLLLRVQLSEVIAVSCPQWFIWTELTMRKLTKSLAESREIVLFLQRFFLTVSHSVSTSLQQITKTKLPHKTKC